MSPRSAEDFVRDGRRTRDAAHGERSGASGMGGPTGAEPAIIPDGTFVKVHPDEHPLPRACEIAVYLQDYHRSSSKLGRWGKIVGIDEEDREYLVMLDDFECVAVPMRRAEWRKSAT